MRFLLLFLILVTIFLCCSDNPISSESNFSNFQYPLSDGSSWSYTITMYDSDQSFENLFNPRESYSTITATKYDQDSVYYKLDEINLATKEDNSVDTVTGYTNYQNRSDGLYILSFGGDGHLVNPKFSISEDVPLKSIDYNIKIGNEWVYRDSTNIYPINKKITGFTEIETEAGTFDCFIVESIYLNASIYVTDYIAREGLIKKTVGVIINNQGGYSPTGRYQTMILTSINQ